MECLFSLYSKGSDSKNIITPFLSLPLSAQLLETSGIQIRADAESDAATKVSMILECIHERLMDIEVLVDMKRVKLEQCIHLLQFESEANQVCGSWLQPSSSSKSYNPVIFFPLFLLLW